MKQGIVSIPTCEVCEIPLQNFSNGRPQTVCQAADCNTVVKLKKTMSATQYKSFFDFQKKLILKNRQELLKSRSRHEALVKKRFIQDEQLLETALEKYPELDKKTQVVNVALGDSNTKALSPDRLDAYMSHLVDMIYEAFDTDHKNLLLDPKKEIAQDEYELTDAISDISDRACAMCKGGCCPAGGNTAYITFQTILSFKRTQPDMNEEDIFQAYLEKIKLETVDDSCINQTPTGCALPREMRSMTCNIYHCDPLRKFQKLALQEKVPATILAIQRPYSNWDKSKKTSLKVASQAIIKAGSTKSIPPLL